MLAFISHNRANKETARLLAIALTGQGIGVWYDEWEIRPGESITGGIENGLTKADVFVLLWSSNAQQSNWVGTEVRAYLRRRVDDATLRIIPIMLDDTPLPTLVADYRGFVVENHDMLLDVAAEIAGNSTRREIIRQLQNQLMDLLNRERVPFSGNPLPYFVCPTCGNRNLERYTATDTKRDDTYFCIQCPECSWNDGTEI